MKITITRVGSDYYCEGDSLEVTGSGPTEQKAKENCCNRNGLVAGGPAYLEVMAAGIEGIKYDGEKLQWSLLPFGVLQDVVFVLMMGAKKYSVDNWKQVKPPVRYFDATMRHLVAYHEGEKYDSESGKSHLVHAICCLIFLLWNVQQEEKQDATIPVDTANNDKIGGEFAGETGFPSTYPGAG